MLGHFSALAGHVGSTVQEAARAALEETDAATAAEEARNNPLLLRERLQEEKDRREELEEKFAILQEERNMLVEERRRAGAAGGSAPAEQAAAAAPPADEEAVRAQLRQEEGAKLREEFKAKFDDAKQKFAARFAEEQGKREAEFATQIENHEAVVRNMRAEVDELRRNQAGTPPGASPAASPGGGPEAAGGTRLAELEKVAQERQEKIDAYHSKMQLLKEKFMQQRELQNQLEKDRADLVFEKSEVEKQLVEEVEKRSSLEQEKEAAGGSFESSSTGGLGPSQQYPAGGPAAVSSLNLPPAVPGSPSSAGTVHHEHLLIFQNEIKQLQDSLKEERAENENLKSELELTRQSLVKNQVDNDHVMIFQAEIRTMQEKLTSEQSERQRVEALLEDGKLEKEKLLEKAQRMEGQWVTLQEEYR